MYISYLLIRTFATHTVLVSVCGRTISTLTGLLVIKNNRSCPAAAVSSSSVHGEYGKKVGRSSIFLDRQSDKDLHTFKVMQL